MTAELPPVVEIHLPSPSTLLSPRAARALLRILLKAQAHRKETP